MSIAEAPVLTPEELLLMPDEGQGFELVHGELREVNVSKESSRVSGKVSHFLEAYSETHLPGWVFPEGTSTVASRRSQGHPPR